MRVHANERRDWRQIHYSTSNALMLFLVRASAAQDQDSTQVSCCLILIGESLIYGVLWQSADRIAGHGKWHRYRDAAVGISCEVFETKDNWD
jgi:hypothetical protein